MLPCITIDELPLPKLAERADDYDFAVPASCGRPTGRRSM
jgi:hypothetical protein